MTRLWIGLLFQVTFVGCVTQRERVSLSGSTPKSYFYQCTDKNNYSVLVTETDRSGLQTRTISKNDTFKEEIAVPSYLQGLTMLFESKRNKSNAIKMQIENTNNFDRSNIDIGKKYSFKGLLKGEHLESWQVTLVLERDPKTTNSLVVTENGVVENKELGKYKKFQVIRKIDMNTGFDAYFEYLSDDEKTICELYKN